MNRLRVPVTQHDHVIGPETAAVTLVEYGDYECPHCGLAHPVPSCCSRVLDGTFGLHFGIFPQPDSSKRRGRG